MNRQLNIYVDPQWHRPLQCTIKEAIGDEVISGELISDTGARYPIEDGIPDLTFPRELDAENEEACKYYDDVASIYDDVAHLTFRIQNIDEAEARRSFIKGLALRPDSRVLEIACGTGRDSQYLAGSLGVNGELHLQDISRGMLLKCREKLSGASARIEFVKGNACFLPFPDGYFDAVFSFGGLGVFGDIAKSLKEMVRVSKVGAKVIAGDESMPPWLYDTEYGKILLNNNPLFKNPIPIQNIPVEARDVVVRWIINGVYYLIEFAVGEGEPKADFDLEIPGRRGGTLRTRYYGKLEGVKPETHRLAYLAQERSGKSMHEWLDEVVRKAAGAELGQEPE